jgi:dihydrofolate reductase
MRKVIASINTTLDAVCDHTVGVPDKELHMHYAGLLKQGSMMLLGRTTYQLMEYWRPFLDSPSDEDSMNDFARAIDSIPKVVFSRTLENVDWPTARLSTRSLEEEVRELKKEPGKDILIGSRSLIIQLMNLQLIDELQLCIHPVVAGDGLPLFEGADSQNLLRLTKTKTFGSGAVLLYYEL